MPLESLGGGRCEGIPGQTLDGGSGQVHLSSPSCPSSSWAILDGLLPSWTLSTSSSTNCDCSQEQGGQEGSQEGLPGSGAPEETGTVSSRTLSPEHWDRGRRPRPWA